MEVSVVVRSLKHPKRSLVKTESNKGRPCLMYGDYKYRQEYQSKTGQITWRCTTRLCTANLKTNIASTKVIELDDTHIHAAKEGAADHQILRASVKRRASDCLGEWPSKIVRSTMREELPASEHLSKESLKNAARCISRIRRSMNLPRKRPKYPSAESIPRHFLQLHQVLDGMSTKTSKNEEFLLLNDIREGTVIFTCDSNLEILCRTDCDIFADGSLTPHCPKFFSQIYTIHGRINDCYVPLIYCLIVDKKENTYLDIWRYIMNRCVTLKLQLTPLILYLDLELPAFTAARRIFPKTRLAICRYHFGAQVWQKMQDFGLCADYMTLTDTGKWLHYFNGLPFLQANEVIGAFTNDILLTMPKDPSANKFSEYFAETFIYSSVFMPDVWAQPPTFDARTTNAAALYHTKLGKRFGVTHHSILSFFGVLMDLQARTYVTSGVFYSGAKHDNKQRSRQRYLVRQYEKYVKGTKTRLEFMKVIGFKYGPLVN